jgi:hypothetical protein
VRATLSDQVVTSATVQIPAWGLPWADVETDTAELLGDNTVELQISDLTLAGTIVTSGAPYGRSRYRVVAGSGGWGEVIEAQSYTSDYQVLRSDVLRDAAAAAGELIDLDGVTGSLESHWTRQRGPAARTLELVSPRAWYVDLGGVTRIGSYPETTYTGDATRMSGTDLAAGRIELAPVSLVGLLPGALVDGLRAADIEVRFGGEGLRATVWAEHGASSRLASALDRIVQALTADRRLAGSWEYRVLQQQGERLDLQPVRTSAGLPYLTRVRARLAPGLRVEHRPGSLVLVTFVDGSPSRPAVTGGDDPDSPGWLPQAIYLEAEGPIDVAADGDASVDATGITTIGESSAEVLAGAGLGRVLREGDTLTLTGVEPGTSATGVTAVVTLGIGIPPLPSRLKA